MRARRGSALILVLLMTLAVAALAVAAIFMSSSAGLLSRFYDRERDFRLAAESGLELVRTRLMRDTSLAVPDTGVVQLLAGYQLTDAAGNVVPRARVNVYAAVTGDTSGLAVPHVTLIAQSYDANGTRHVRRLDLRRESFARYALFADSFPSTVAHGPGTLLGRAHTNQTWYAGGTPVPVHVDTVSAVVGFGGTGNYDIDTLVGGTPIPYPKDSTYAWMHTLAVTASLNVTPVANGSRLEFVSFDANNNGSVEEREGFVRVFDLQSGVASDTNRLRASPVSRTVCQAAFFFGCSGGQSQPFYDWDDPIIQNQCGAFYHRSGRWHFFPLATHRSEWARNIIYGPGGSNYPQVNNPLLNDLGGNDYDAVETLIDDIETVRCFPAGSPFLMPTERFTTATGVISANPVNNVVPFGVVAPPGGWPSGAPYGGSDTTFSVSIRTCTIRSELSGANSGRCVAGSIRTLGSWRAFGGGTPVTGVPSSVRQPQELAYLWPYHPLGNSASRRVLSATAGPLLVSGDVRGQATLRVAGRVVLVDRLRYQADPNDAVNAACTSHLGLIATGDILVVDGLTSRVRRVARTASNFFGVEYYAESVDASLGAEPRFTVQGNLMSLAGTVGVEHPDLTMGDASSQLECPDDAAASTRTNGGCYALTGGAAMRTYSRLHSTTTANSGFRYFGTPDRCQSTDRRPPFFPLTNRYKFVRTLEIEPSLANSPPRIRAILMRLKGRAL